MKIQASASELAFYAGRVCLAREALRLGRPAVAVEDGSPVSASEAVAALERASKPLRVTGAVRDGILRLRLSPVDVEPQAQRFQIRQRNLGDSVPGIDPEAPDDAMLLVIAFDQLLRVSKGTWRQFNREYWIDGLGWSADHPTSPWAKEFGLPPAALEGVRTVILAGYSVPRGLRQPYTRDGWEAA